MADEHASTISTVLAILAAAVTAVGGALLIAVRKLAGRPDKSPNTNGKAGDKDTSYWERSNFRTAQEAVAPVREELHELREEYRDDRKEAREQRQLLQVTLNGVMMTMRELSVTIGALKDAVTILANHNHNRRGDDR